MELPKRYKIGELAKLLNISTSTLKTWSKRGYIPRAHRDGSLQQSRYWTEEQAKEIAEYKSRYYNYY